MGAGVSMRYIMLESVCWCYELRVWGLPSLAQLTLAGYARLGAALIPTGRILTASRNFISEPELLV